MPRMERRKNDPHAVRSYQKLLLQISIYMNEKEKKLFCYPWECFAVKFFLMTNQILSLENLFFPKCIIIRGKKRKKTTNIENIIQNIHTLTRMIHEPEGLEITVFSKHFLQRTNI